MKIDTRIPNIKPPKKKTKVNKRRLFFTFFTAFIIFFFICTFVASMLTPSIDVPVLNNENEVVDSLTSDDFKGRLDPRLKSIEMQEVTGPADSARKVIKEGSPSADADQQPEDPAVQDMQGMPNEEGLMPEADPLPMTPTAEPQRSAIPKPQTQRPVPRTQKPAVQQPVYPSDTEVEQDAPDSGLNLRRKIDVQNQAMGGINKVIVGSYSSPAQAKRTLNQLNGSGLNVAPFIVERDGVYSVQVGSFSNGNKAANLADELRRRNMSAQIIQE